MTQWVFDLGNSRVKCAPLRADGTLGEMHAFAYDDGLVASLDQAMPATLGWHPWFRKPDQVLFSPSAMYPRDGEGIAVLPCIAPTPGPWDDCFINQGDVTLVSAGQRLRLRADTDHWVVYDGAAHATCVEPQTGPPDGFTLAPTRLQPGQRLQLTFELRWEIDTGGKHRPLTCC